GADLIAAGFDAVVGQDVATAQIDVKSGVTLTSNAINEAFKAAAADEAVSVAAVGDVAKTYEMQVKGMAKKTFTLRISVDDAGVIVAATCPENSEDKGYIALTDDALSALVGQNITDAKYDTVAGVTVTSNAVNSALDAIAAHVRNEEVQ
ncbi:MAG: FMN-binding protein, partial [Christensenellales bacterium]|nr:FMN-binding protein [Christensenellales bacterium]